MRAIYPDNGNGDRPADAEASPDVRPWVERDTDVTLTLEVDGEMFPLRQDESDGTAYTWLSVPNPGYGFGTGPTPNLSLDWHRSHGAG